MNSIPLSGSKTPNHTFGAHIEQTVSVAAGGQSHGVDSQPGDCRWPHSAHMKWTISMVANGNLEPAWSGQSAWWLQMATLSFLGSFYGYAWVSKTVYHPRGLKKLCEEQAHRHCCHYCFMTLMKKYHGIPCYIIPWYNCTMVNCIPWYFETGKPW